MGGVEMGGVAKTGGSPLKKGAPHKEWGTGFWGPQKWGLSK